MDKIKYLKWLRSSNSDGFPDLLSCSLTSVIFAETLVGELLLRLLQRNTLLSVWYHFTSPVSFQHLSTCDMCEQVHFYLSHSVSVILLMEKKQHVHIFGCLVWFIDRTQTQYALDQSSRIFATTVDPTKSRLTHTRKIKLQKSLQQLNTQHK